MRAVGEAVEYDPGGLDGDHRPVVDHQGADILHAHEAVSEIDADAQVRQIDSDGVRCRRAVKPRPQL